MSETLGIIMKEPFARVVSKAPDPQNPVPPSPQPAPTNPEPGHPEPDPATPPVK